MRGRQAAHVEERGHVEVGVGGAVAHGGELGAGLGDDGSVGEHDALGAAWGRGKWEGRWRSRLGSVCRGLWACGYARQRAAHAYLWCLM